MSDSLIVALIAGGILIVWGICYLLANHREYKRWDAMWEDITKMPNSDFHAGWNRFCFFMRENGDEDTCSDPVYFGLFKDIWKDTREIRRDDSDYWSKEELQEYEAALSDDEYQGGTRYYNERQRDIEYEPEDNISNEDPGWKYFRKQQ